MQSEESLKPGSTRAISLAMPIGDLLLVVGIFMLGWWLSITPLAWAGIYLFGGVALFSLITLPVEFDASRRAKQLLVSEGYITGEEQVGVARVLDAAALTYVAALAQALSTLLYYVFLLTGARRRD